jgi:hypothetical protein
VITARTTAPGALVVEFPCRACGRPIRLLAADGGTELADRAEFLRDHRQCLVANIPSQRTGES